MFEDFNIDKKISTSISCGTDEERGLCAKDSFLSAFGKHCIGGVNDHRNPFGFVFGFGFALIGWMGGTAARRAALLLADWPPEKLKEARESGSLLEASEVANVVMFMLTRPRGMTIRDVVMLPTNFDL